MLALTKALPSCPKLEALGLGSNNLGEEACLALAAALPSCPKLEALVVSRNSLGERAKAALLAAWRTSLPNGHTRPEDRLRL